MDNYYNIRKSHDSVLFQALEMQGKHAEAVRELSKLSLTHRIFPPEESSVCVLLQGTSHL